MSERNDRKTEEKNKAFYESDSYFDLSEATADVQISTGARETASAIVKLSGKSIFNVGLFVGKASFSIAKETLKNSPDLLARTAEANLKENSHKMSSEQVERAKEYIKNNKGKKLF